MNKSLLTLIIPVLLLTLLACQSDQQRADVADWPQFRGPNRDGKSSETGLLKEWPADGPEQLWMVENIGDGYSTAIIAGSTLYTTGMIDSLDYLTAFSLNGDRKWQVPYGKAWRSSWPGVRVSPTIENNRIYLISGMGEISCLNAANGKTVWSLNAYEKFEGEYKTWGIAENLLIADDKVIYTPAGKKTTMVALNKKTGETVWMSESIGDYTGYVSPILVKRGGRNIVVTVTGNYIIGVDADSGTLLWKDYYTGLFPEDGPDWAPIINCNMPMYQDGRIFITSGYDHPAAMYALSEDGGSIELAWQSPVLDTHHGNVVLVDGYIYGSNWINNREGNWVCLDWETGEVAYETEWKTKGSLTYADGMLYCYEEKDGTVGLVEATPEEFRVISTFRNTAGHGPHWAHPVIHNGVLYIRHGDTLTAYTIKA
ncbi:PQQ-binding-like beta-propeller repeat protein [bacterium]|nr:PQQ-binding-like beta-propeller repeat protein [bacterium]